MPHPFFFFFQCVACIVCGNNRLTMILFYEGTDRNSQSGDEICRVYDKKCQCDILKMIENREIW